MQLLAGGGTSYSWLPLTGLNNPSINNPVANPTTTTTYTVLVTDVNGCKKSDDVIVTVNTLPPADAGVSTSICLNDSTHLIASGGTGYSWSPSTGLSNSTVANPTAIPNSTTLYTVVVTDNNNCSASDTVTVFVNSLPTADAGLNDSICNLSSVVIAANVGFNQYSWSSSPVGFNSSSQTNTVTPNITTDRKSVV